MLVVLSAASNPGRAKSNLASNPLDALHLCVPSRIKGYSSKKTETLSYHRNGSEERKHNSDSDGFGEVHYIYENPTIIVIFFEQFIFESSAFGC